MLQGHLEDEVVVEAEVIVEAEVVEREEGEGVTEVEGEENPIINKYMILSFCFVFSHLSQHLFVAICKAMYIVTRLIKAIVNTLNQRHAVLSFRITRFELSELNYVTTNVATLVNEW